MAGRRHWRTVAVVVVAVGARASVVAQARTDIDDHPAFGAGTVPIEADRLEVLKGGEAVELVILFVVGHDGEGNPSVDAAQRDVDGDSLDPTRIDFHIFLGVVVAVVGVKVDVYITPIGVVTDVLHIIVDRDRAVVVHHHWL